MISKKTARRKPGKTLQRRGLKARVSVAKRRSVMK